MVGDNQMRRSTISESLITSISLSDPCPASVELPNGAGEDDLVLLTDHPDRHCRGIDWAVFFDPRARLIGDQNWGTGCHVLHDPEGILAGALATL